jgi:hypothetical protein
MVEARSRWLGLVATHLAAFAGRSRPARQASGVMAAEARLERLEDRLEARLGLVVALHRAGSASPSRLVARLAGRFVRRLATV